MPLGSVAHPFRHTGSLAFQDSRHIKFDVALNMDFSVEFYETESGRRPVQEFLDELKVSDPDDFAAILAGLVKLKKTNFDRYLERQLRDPAFAARFERAGDAWDVALQIASLREQAGLSQKDLARLLKTSQQQISRLESPGYEGHSLSTLRRVAGALNARVRIVFVTRTTPSGNQLAEGRASYTAKREKGKRR